MTQMALISFKNVTLDFPIYGTNTRSLKKQLVRLSTGGMIKRNKEIIKVRAINNLSLEIEHGERVGIVGHNGAGKSTLLRVISGIYEPNVGTINIQGRVTALLDIMLGLDQETTGLENIIIRGVFQGFTRAQIKAKQKEIADFTGLGDYLRMPIRTYSAGMQLRLAFAIATAIEPEILLLDEVVGAGDADFMKKAQQRIGEIIHNSSIVVLASHDISNIRRICTRLLWMEAGQVKYDGPVNTGLEYYRQATHPEEAVV